jgi:hypothetical protein
MHVNTASRRQAYWSIFLAHTISLSNTITTTSTGFAVPTVSAAAISHISHVAHSHVAGTARCAGRTCGTSSLCARAHVHISAPSTRSMCVHTSLSVTAIASSSSSSAAPGHVGVTYTKRASHTHCQRSTHEPCSRTCDGTYSDTRCTLMPRASNPTPGHTQTHVTNRSVAQSHHESAHTTQSRLFQYRLHKLVRLSLCGRAHLHHQHQHVE